MSRVFPVICLILLILLGICFGVYQYYVSYKYEMVIGSHMNNAKDMNTPSRMIEELQAAKQGMIDEGLKENDYGAFIFKKPDNSMAFQYQHLDSIIERCYAVEQWRTEVYGNNSVNAETLGDVYESKMDNLREFIMEDGRSDWIAKDAWYVKNHIVLYLSGVVFWAVFVIILSIIIAVLVEEAIQ